MRVTENSIAANYLNSLNKTRERMVQLQTELATGKRVQKPSDDPQAAGAILRIQRNLDRNAQFQKNAAEAQSMMESTSAALDSFSSGLEQLKEIVTRANNGGVSESLHALGDQVDQLLSRAVDEANTQFNGKYLFGGRNTLTPPFAIAADRSSVTANPEGISGSILYQMDEGSTQVVNISGQEAFQGTQPFDLIIQIRNQLWAGTAPSAAQIQSVSDELDNSLSAGAKAGAMDQYFQSIQKQLEDHNTLLTTLLSTQQDTDVAEAVTSLKQQEIMLDAATNTAARIIPKTLIDFLK